MSRTRRAFQVDMAACQDMCAMFVTIAVAQ